MAVVPDFGIVTPVRDGTDVILRCKTSAKPEAHSYYWYHDVSDSSCLIYSHGEYSYSCNNIFYVDGSIIKRNLVGKIALSNLDCGFEVLFYVRYNIIPVPKDLIFHVL